MTKPTESLLIVTLEHFSPILIHPKRTEGTLESLYESNPLVPRAASFVPIDTDVAQTDATTVGASISSGARRASIPSTIQKQGTCHRLLEPIF